LFLCPGSLKIVGCILELERERAKEISTFIYQLSSGYTPHHVIIRVYAEVLETSVLEEQSRLAFVGVNDKIFLLLQW